MDFPSDGILSHFQGFKKSFLELKECLTNGFKRSLSYFETFWEHPNSQHWIMLSHF